MSSIRIAALVVAPSVLLTFSLSGCQAHKQATDNAKVMTAYVQALRGKISHYEKEKTELLKDRVRASQRLEGRAVVRESDVASTLAAWTISAPEKVAIFEALVSSSEAGRDRHAASVRLAEEHEAALKAARITVNVRDAELRRVVDSLTALAADKKAKEKLKQAFDYISATAGNIELAELGFQKTTMETKDELNATTDAEATEDGQE